MKRGTIIGLGLVLAAVIGDAALAAERPWYEGGTLDRATLARWSGATDQNRLATAAGWTIDFMGKDRAKIAGSDGLKRWSETLVACVDQVAGLVQHDYAGAAGDAAKGCMTKLGYPHD